MNKNYIRNLALWLFLGIFSGILFLNLNQNDDLPQVLENTSPSVVNIWSLKKWKAWQERSNLLGIKRYRQVIKTGFVPNGSGVIVSKEGNIITSFHVVDESFKNNQKLIVEFNDGSTEEALIIGFDLDADVAVIKSLGEKIYSPVQVRKNLEELKVGETVVAIGNPQGLGQSFSIGIVSAINRQFKNKNGSFIQTDASINPGNSGGALVDSKGKLIGITNFIESTSGGSQGLNFAIPVDIVMESYKTIIN